MNTIIAFINAASSSYFAAHAAPMVDEDLAMAFDAALIFAAHHPHADSAEAHTAGHAHITG